MELIYAIKIFQIRHEMVKFVKSKLIYQKSKEQSRKINVTTLYLLYTPQKKTVVLFLLEFKSSNKIF